MTSSALSLVRQNLAALKGTSIPIRADLRQWNRAMIMMFTDLSQIRKAANIPFVTSTARAHSNISLLIQQLRTMQGLTNLNITSNRPSLGNVGRGGGGGARGGGPGFGAGLWMGAGMPYAANPAMMAGELTSKGVISSIKVAADLEAQMADLRRVSGMSASQGAGFKQSMFQTSTAQAGVSVQDLMEIANTGARMGVVDKGGVKGLEDFTQQLAMVKNAITDIPTEDLANSMGRVLNVFNLGTDRVASFGSALTAMDNVSTASARDILDITTRLSGTAVAIGMTLPQVVALSSVLKDVGISNEVAGSSFSQILRKMASDSDKFANAIGMDATAFANAYRNDPIQALGLVISKFNEMKDTIAGQEFIDELGLKGVRTGGSLQQLATKFEEVARRTKIASDETSTLNALTAANALKSATAEAAFTRFNNAMTQLGDTLGSLVLPRLTDFTTVLTGITKQMANGDFSIFMGSVKVALGGPGSGPGDMRVDRQRNLEDQFLEMFHGDPYKNQTLPGKPKMAALPEKNPNPPAPAKPANEVAFDQAAFRKANPPMLWQRAMGGLGGIGGRLGAAQGAAEIFGDRIQDQAGKLGGLLKDVVKGPKDPAVQAKLLKDVEDQRKAALESMSRVFVPPSQRKEFLARAGQDPTDKDRKDRPIFAMALEEAKQELGRFDTRKTGLTAGMNFGNGKTPLSVGSNLMESGKRIQEDILNSHKDEGVKDTNKKLADISTILKDIRDQGMKGAAAAGAAVLAKP